MFSQRSETQKTSANILTSSDFHNIEPFLVTS